MLYLLGMAIISLWTTWITIKFQAPQIIAYTLLIITLFCTLCSFEPPRRNQ